MEPTTPAMLIKRYLESLDGRKVFGPQDFLDEDVLEVLTGVSWVREALAQASPTLAPEDQREVLFGLKSLAA